MYFKPSSEFKSKIMKTITFILMFTPFFMGCSSSYLVTKNGGDDEMSYQEFNREIMSKNVTLKFTKGPESDGMNIRVDTNYARWHDFNLQETRSVPTGLLKAVGRQNRFLGGLEGFGIGLMSGAALGYLVGSLSGAHNKSLDEGGLPWQFSILFGGAVGGITGAIIGAVFGHKYEYRFVRK